MIRWYDWVIAVLAADLMITFGLASITGDNFWINVLNSLLAGFVYSAWTGEDHAGPRLHIELFGYMFAVKIYNINHWNWKAGRFYTEEEAQAEYEEDQQWRKDNNIDQDPDDKYAKWAEK